MPLRYGKKCAVPTLRLLLTVVRVSDLYHVRTCAHADLTPAMTPLISRIRDMAWNGMAITEISVLSGKVAILMAQRLKMKQTCSIKTLSHSRVEWPCVKVDVLLTERTYYNFHKVRK